MAAKSVAMKVTMIQRQQKRTDRYSVFIDGDYAFSFSEATLLKSGLHTDQLLTEAEIKKLKQQASDDVLYNQAVRYTTTRLHSKWEVIQYLERKHMPPALQNIILNKLSDLNLIDDRQYARAYVQDRQRLRPTSRRKIVFDLRKKHVAEDIIEEALNTTANDEVAILRAIIDRKRQQPRYRDDIKLKQYLARQGFHYGDIVTALNQTET